MGLLTSEMLAIIGAVQDFSGAANFSDLLQDFIGARALLQGGDPYPVLGAAQAALGIDWPIQLTVVWLLGLALAWRFRHRHLVAGVCIGVAALTKLLPAIALVPFIRKRQWGALVGFGLVWFGAVAILLLLNADVFSAYFFANRETSLEQIAHLDNGALLPFGVHTAGFAGLAAGAALVVLVTFLALRRPASSPEVWALWTWLSVALLPIAWTYSLLPLFPYLLRTVRRSGPVPAVLAIGALLAPYWGPLPSSNPWAVTMTLILSALAFALAVQQSTRQRGEVVAVHAQAANQT